MRSIWIDILLSFFFLKHVVHSYVFTAEVIEGHQEHLYFYLFCLANIQNYFLQLFLLSFQGLGFLQLFLQLQVLPVHLSTVVSQFLDFLLEVVHFICVDIVGLGGQDGWVGWIRFSFESGFHLILKLFEPELFSFQLHFHCKLGFLHVYIFFIDVLHLFLHFGDNGFLLFNNPVQFSSLPVVIWWFFSVTLRIRQLLLQMFNSILILFKPQHFVLKKDVFLPDSGKFFLMFSDSMQ